MESFSELGLRPELLRALEDMRFREPTPVQTASIPSALAGRDVLASAATGSGKSAAFGLPILNMLADQTAGTTRALILAPTRELAAQIAEHLTLLAKHTRVRIAPVYGGVGYGAQASAFRRGTEIIVATPGRLLDHMEQGTANLKNISLLVFDEADRMLDMGFLPAVRRVIAALPKARQTMFFSATLPPRIKQLTQEILTDPVRVDLSPKSGGPSADVTQTVYTVGEHRKSTLLVELLRDNTIFSAIVFTRTKARANRLAMLLSSQKIAAERIHGNLSQSKRTQVLADFKKDKYRVLVATDIAARGIDVLNLGHVVNYDVPNVPEEYIHRIGRTARAQAKGDAITFVAPEEEKQFSQIEKTLGKRLDRAKLPVLPAMELHLPKADPRDTRDARRPMTFAPRRARSR